MSHFNETKQSFGMSSKHKQSLEVLDEISPPAGGSQINLQEFRYPSKGLNTSMGTRTIENKLKVNPFRPRESASREDEQFAHVIPLMGQTARLDKSTIFHPRRVTQDHTKRTATANFSLGSTTGHQASMGHTRPTKPGTTDHAVATEKSKRHLLAA